MDVRQFNELILEPILKQFDPAIPYSKVAHKLILETIYHESDRLTYIAQVPNDGPARGLCQMEKPTFDWLMKDVMPKRSWWAKMRQISPLFPNIEFSELDWNLKLCVIMCRIRYLVIPERLPEWSPTPHSRADYWYHFYNASGVPSRKDKYISDALNIIKVE